MNEIINKFLLVEDKFMPEMHLKKPVFTNSACGLFTKNKERIKKFMQTRNTDFIHKNQLDKACFQHDLKDKGFKIASDPKYDGYQRGLASIVYKFFDKKSVSLDKSKGSGIINEPNYQLTNELHKPIIRKFKKEKFIHILKMIFGVLI